MSLKTNQVIAGFNVLDALLKADEKNQYVFSTATRCTFAGNRRRARPVNDEFNQAKEQKIRDLGEEITVKNDKGEDVKATRVKGDCVEIFKADIIAALNKETDVTFTPITKEDLAGVTAEFKKTHPDAKENQIPISLIEGMIETGLLTE